MNAIEHATQPRIQTSFELFKTFPNNKNVKHIDPKKKTHTHTHTHNKSNQFYILKTGQDSLVSIH